MGIPEESKPKRVLHLTDIIELYEIAEDAVQAAAGNDCRFNEDGSLAENVLVTRESSERELRRLRGKDDSVFTIREGKWMGHSVREYAMEVTATEIRDRYLIQEKKKICTLMRSVATWNGMAFGSDITENELLSLFSTGWFQLLKSLSDIADWQKDHHIPSPVLSSNDLWFFMKQLHWDGCVAASDLIVHDAVSAVSERIFVKHSYSCFTSEFLQFIHQQHIDKLYFVGVDTDACVLKSAFDAADYDIPFEVLEDYCASSGGEELHEAAVRIIRRNLAHRRYE